MKKRELKIDYWTCRKSFPAGYERLCEEARSAAGKAYCVYSGFAVGAAVLLENGEIVLGNNQENAAYPNGLCAERTALFYANAAYPEVAVKALAIAACYQGKSRKGYVAPCGACRQVMAEVVKRYGQDFDVIMVGEEETLCMKASDLLPFSFEYA